MLDEEIMKFMWENSLLYTAVESSRMQFSPMREFIRINQNWFSQSVNPTSYTNFGQAMRASLEIAERITRHYPKPSFESSPTTISGRSYNVTEEVCVSKPFCDLLHFKKESYNYRQPKLLLVAPLAGHHATLLKGTVSDCLPHFDVYITDWKDASQVPVDRGTFNMDDYIDYLIDFYRYFDRDVHVMAVCQPTVTALAATAILARKKSKESVPKSLILMGGPVDARENPTEVNKYATGKSLEWFKSNTITRVPINYPGFMRPVYPGFLQLAGFMAMNLQSHIDSHIKLYQNLLADEEEAEKRKKFYNEYLSVMDLPAEYFLQTIKEVFQDYSLATGKLISRGRKVDLAKIENPALMGIEGGKDDIAGVGQTKAALDLCKNIPRSKKRYHLQENVGHYGVFNGSKFRKDILPGIKDFVKKHD